MIRVVAPKRTLITRARYVLAVIRRFRVTLLLAALLLVPMPLVYVALYTHQDGSSLGYPEALHHVYFLLFGQPSLEYFSGTSFVLLALDLLIPPFGIALVVDGVVRFAYLFFAKHKADKEWIEVVAETLKGHVIVCGAGRVGFRVANQLTSMGKEVIVIEKKQDAPFAAMLRDQQIPVLVDDARSPKCLERCNVKAASAIVCSTDDDLSNLNVALDARKANPAIRIVMRLFDDDLVERVRENFSAEAHSTSALAGNTLALSALDPRIVHSFNVGGHLMVVSNFTVNARLSGQKVSDVRDSFGALTLSMETAGAAEKLHPTGPTVLKAGDKLTLQCNYAEYLKLREHTGEATPPLSAYGPQN